MQKQSIEQLRKPNKWPEMGTQRIKSHESNRLSISYILVMQYTNLLHNLEIALFRFYCMTYQIHGG